MTTPTRCDTADHLFVEQGAMPHDMVPLEIGYFSSLLRPFGLPLYYPLFV